MRPFHGIRVPLCFGLLSLAACVERTTRGEQPVDGAAYADCEQPVAVELPDGCVAPLRCYSSPSREEAFCSRACGQGGEVSDRWGLDASVCDEAPAGSQASVGCVPQNGAAGGYIGHCALLCSEQVACPVGMECISIEVYVQVAPHDPVTVSYCG